MKITFEIDDDNVIADALDNVVASHLRSHKNMIALSYDPHPDDIIENAKIIAAIDVLLKYYTGEDYGQT